MVLSRRRHSSAGGLSGRGAGGGAARWTSAAGEAGLAGAGDDGVAQKPQQLRHGDRNQPGVQVGAGLLLALHCRGNGEVDIGQQADHGPGLPADDLPCVQAGGLLGELVIFLDAPRATAMAISRDRASGRLRHNVVHD